MRCENTAYLLADQRQESYYIISSSNGAEDLARFDRFSNSAPGPNFRVSRSGSLVFRSVGGIIFRSITDIYGALKSRL